MKCALGRTSTASIPTLSVLRTRRIMAIQQRGSFIHQMKQYAYRLSTHPVQVNQRILKKLQKEEQKERPCRKTAAAGVTFAVLQPSQWAYWRGWLGANMTLVPIIPSVCSTGISVSGMTTPWWTWPTSWTGDAKDQWDWNIQSRWKRCNS